LTLLPWSLRQRNSLPSLLILLSKFPQ